MTNRGPMRKELCLCFYEIQRFTDKLYLSACESRINVFVKSRDFSWSKRVKKRETNKKCLPPPKICVYYAFLRKVKQKRIKNIQALMEWLDGPYIWVRGGSIKVFLEPPIIFISWC